MAEGDDTGPPVPAGLAPDGTWDMPDNNGPCRTWPIDPTCSCFTGTGVPDGPPWPAELARGVEVATEYLWRKTAGRYGLCWEQVRPCPAPGPELAPRGGVAWPDPNGTAPPGGGWGLAGGLGPYDESAIGGGWLGLCGCGNAGSCGCGPASEIQLPGPVWQDLSPAYPHGRQYTVDVYIDGHRVPYEAYRLIDNGYLIPVGGWAWPVEQDVSRPISHHAGVPEWMPLEGTWGIRYWRGLPVPAAGVLAVTQLACEIWKLCTGDDTCKLPRGVTDIQREGVSYTLVDQNEDMLANMPDVGGWVSSVNPHGLKEQPFVVSPDLPRFKSESRLRPLWGQFGKGGVR